MRTTFWLGVIFCAGWMAGCAGLGAPPGPRSTVVVIPQPEGRAYDFLAYVSDADPGMDDADARRRAVRRAMSGHCHPAEIIELYAHPVGPRSGGGVVLSYTVAVICRTPGER
ncbi:MAG: hypothetical protein OEY97_03115 [Nitrospirota bacterium]|nr:hypothetical protein [Nitrospirota bacterium]